MLFSISILLWCAPILFLILLRQKWSSYRKIRTAALQLGCQRPPKYPHRSYWGTDLMKQRMKASAEGWQSKLFLEHFNTIGETWEENFLGIKVYNSAQVQNIQHVGTTGFDDYGKPATAFFTPVLGKGIFSMDGADWRHSRDLIKPIFSRSEISDVDTLGFHTGRFLDKIPSEGAVIDLQPLLHNFFLDTSTEFIFGQSIDSQLTDDPNNSKELLDAFMGALGGVAKRRIAGRLGQIKYMFDKPWKVHIDRVNTYVDAHVKRALAEAEAAPDNEKKESEDTIPKRYVLITEMAKEVKDPIKLRSQLLNVLMPARDSTSILVANCIFHLARNPEMWVRLRKESLALGDQPLTFELLKSLHSFRYTLHETLRLQGPAGRVQREALRDTVLPVGGGSDCKAPMLVQKGEIVALNTLGPNHSSEIWGDDVEEFNPERWIDRKITWEFTPFFGGPRICPAQQQVLTQSVYLLVTMTRKFAKIRNEDPVIQYVEQIRMLTESRNGVKVSFQ